MSREIDEKIVQMKFENGEFEKGIQTSIHSLEELKKGLDFKNASKGLESLDKSVKGLSFDGLAAGIEALNNRFTLLGITGLNVMNRLSNAAINTGISLVKNLSIDQVSTGWDKYADKTKAMQTIMSATAKEFSDTEVQMKFVNDQLNKLNWFTDETSYSFLDMVSNIGKFTSNNIKLDESVTAMQGIANWAAQSGAGVNEASRAMYNLSQAIASGSLRLMDWMSIENANMGTARFKETVIETALEMGTLKKRADGVITTMKGLEVTTGNFRSVLTEGWITSDVLITTLEKYGSATNRIKELVDQTGVSTSKLLSHIDDYTNSYGQLSIASSKLGKTQEETLKIFNDFTPSIRDMANTSKNAGVSVSALADAVSQYSKGTLDMNATAAALGMNVNEVETTLRKFQAPMQKIESIVSGTSVSVGQFATYISKYSEGSFDLAEVSEELGLSIEETRAIMEEFQTDTMKFGLEAFKAAKEVKTLSEALNTVRETVQSGWMQTFELIFGNYEEAKELWTNVMEILSNIFAGSASTRNEMFGIFKDMGGSSYVIASLYNSLEAIILILGAVKSAWRSVFPPQTAESLFKLSQSLYHFTNSMKLTEEASKELQKVLRTVFLILDTGTYVLSQTVKSGFGLLSRVLKEVNVDISGFTNGLLGGVESVNKYVKEQTWLTDAFNSFSDILISAIQNIKLFINSISKFGPVKTVLDSFHELFTADFNGVASIINFVGNTFSGFINLIATTPFPKSLNDLENFFKNFSNLVDLELSKSGINFDGFLGSLRTAVDSIGGIFKMFQDIVASGIKTVWGFGENVDWAGVTLLAFGIVVVYVVNKIADAIMQISKLFTALGDIAEAVGNVVKGAAKVLESVAGIVKAASVAVYAAAIVEVATAIAILAASLAVLAHIPADVLNNTAFVLGLIVAAVVGVTVTLSRLPDVNKAGEYLLSFAAVIGIFALAMNAIDVSSDDKVKQIWTKLGVIGLLMMELVAICALMSRIAAPISIGATAFVGIAASIWLMVRALDDLSKFDQKQLLKALPLFTILSAIVVAIGRFSGSITILEKDQKAVKTSTFRNVLAAVLGIYAIIGAIWLLGRMNPETLIIGVMALIPVMGAIVILLRSSQIAGEHASKAGRMILQIALTLNILIPAIKGLASLPLAVIAKGSAVIIALSTLVFRPLIESTRYAGPNAAKAGLMLLSMAGAIAILQLVVKTLGKLDVATLAKGVTAVSVLALSLTPAIAALGDSSEATTKSLGKIIVMVTLLGVIVYLLAKFTDSKKALAAATSMALIIAAIALPIKMLDNMNNPNTKIPLRWIATIGILSGIVIALSKFSGDVTKAIGAAAAVGVLMLALGTTAKIMDKTDLPTMDKIFAMVALVAALGGVMMVLGDISKETDPVALLALTTGMSEILISIGIAALIMSNTRMPDLTTMVTLSLFVSAIGGILVLLSGFGDVERMLIIATGISKLLLALSISMRILDNVKIEGTSVGAMAVMIALATLTGILIGTLSYMVNPESVLPIAEAMSLVMLAMAGVVAVLSLIPAPNITSAISALGTLVIFVGAMGLLLTAIGALIGDADAAGVIASGGEVLKQIGIAIGNFVGGIVGGFIGGAAEGIINSFPAICDSIKEGVRSLVEMMTSLENTPLNVLDLLGTVTGAVAALTAAEFISGLEALPLIGRLITEGKENLKENFKLFAEAITEFSNNLGDIQPYKVKSAAEAVAALASATSTIPTEGGLFGALFGDIDLDSFVTNIPKLGQGLADFAAKTVGITDDTVKGAVNAAMMLVELEKSLPREDGTLQAFLGSQDMGEFGNRLVRFGMSLATFSNLMSLSLNEDGVEKAKKAGDLMVSLENSLPREGGVLQDLFLGNKDIGKFGTNLETFGAGLVALGTKCATLNTIGIENAVTAGEDLATLENSLTKESGGALDFWFGGESSFKTFGENLAWFGQGLASLSLNASRADFTILDEVITFIKTIGDVGNIGAATGTLVDAVKKMFSDLDELIRTENHDILLAAKNISKNIVDGTIIGLKVNKHRAIDEMTGFAKSLVERFEEELKIHSPSVVMKEEGIYIVQGVAEGIKGDMSAEEAASQKAQNIVDAFQAIFDTADFRINFGNVKLESWQLGEGRGANWQEILEHDLQAKVNELNATGEKVQAAYAKYIALRQSGANEKTVRQAEIDYIEMSNTYQSIRNGIIDAQIESSESMIEELDLLDDIRQAEYDAWLSSKEGKNASVAEKTNKEMGLLVSQLDSLAQATAILRAKHQAIIEEFGEDSTEARNAYIKVKNSEQKLNETYDGIIEKQKGAYDTIKEARDASLKEYSEYIAEYGEQLTQMGFTAQQVRDTAAKMFKLDKYWGDDLGGGYTKKDLEETMAKAAEPVNLVKEEIIDIIDDGSVEVVTVKMADTIPVAITNVTPKAQSATKDLMGSVVAEIEASAPDVKTAFENTMLGGVEGIFSTKPLADSAMAESAMSALQTVKDVFQEKSPSKAMMKIGAYAMEGLAIGISQNGNYAVNAMATQTENLIDGATLLTSKLADAVSNSMDLSPVITPVLDMDNVINGSKKINGLFTSNVGLDVSSIDLRTRQVQTNLKSDGTVTPSASGETVVNNNFTQNNYSPKALSRYDIYRQTRNQILQLKGMTHK